MLDILVCKAEIAMEYGIDAAVLLHNMVYWVQKNAAEGRHMHSGRYWTYNSVAGLHELFPVWTRAKLRRLIQKCEEDGLLLVGNYSDDPLDRTKWYSPSDKILCYYTGAPSICQNQQMHLPESALACAENSKCYNEQSLPEVTTPYSPPEGDGRKRKRKEPKAEPDWKPERFAKLWALYPCGKSKQAAIAAWDSLRADDDLLEAMGHALVKQMASEEWQRGVGIPYLSTWLNQRRWEDEDRAPQRPPDGGGGSVIERRGDYEI